MYFVHFNPPIMKTRVLLVDDHELVRGGIRSLLAKEPSIGEMDEAGNGHEAVCKARDFKPDVVLMDYEMPNFNGIYATREILKENPDTKIVLLSAYLSRDHVMEGVHAGIRGFLPKEVTTGEMIEAIKAIAAGETWFKGDVAELIAPSLIDHIKSGQKVKINGGLTRREREIVALLAGGMTPRYIAGKLSISKRTVDVHKSNVFKKLKINNISELVRYAIRQGLVKL